MQILIDELPKSCVGCKYFAEHRRQCNLELCLQWNEVKFKFDDCPLIDIKDHDREKDKRIKELEDKIRKLQEVDNKRAFRLYAVLYDVLEKQDPENVASRIDYLTGKDYSEMCELYKTAKNLKQHDRELVKEVCEKIEDWCNKNFNWVGNGIGYDGQDYNEMIGSNNTINKLRGFLNQIQKEFEK